MHISRPTLDDLRTEPADGRRPAELHEIVSFMRADRDIARKRHGEAYSERVRPYMDRVRARMKSREMNPLEAMMELVDADDPANEDVRIWLVAATVEIIIEAGVR